MGNADIAKKNSCCCCLLLYKSACLLAGIFMYPIWAPLKHNTVAQNVGTEMGDEMPLMTRMTQSRVRLQPVKRCQPDKTIGHS